MFRQLTSLMYFIRYPFCDQFKITIYIGVSPMAPMLNEYHSCPLHKGSVSSTGNHPGGVPDLLFELNCPIRRIEFIFRDNWVNTILYALSAPQDDHFPDVRKMVSIVTITYCGSIWNTVRTKWSQMLQHPIRKFVLTNENQPA